MYKNQFNKLSLEQKAWNVEENGRYLLVRYTSRHKILLFSLSNFYIEVWIKEDNESDFIMEKIVGFKDTDFLEPYLNLLSIDPLLKNTQIF